MLTLGVLASHTGTNFQAIVDACESGNLNARVGVLISNNSRSGAVERAHRSDINSLHLSSKTHPDPKALDTAILNGLQSHDVDLIVLAGYMKKLGSRVLKTYEGKIINVHPALLPKYGGQGFFGAHVHEAVLAAGDTETGATVHLVSEEYDTGPTLAQVRMPVEPGDDAEALAARLRPLEHQLLLKVIAEFSP